MIRRAEQTVRWPVVRSAPMARSWALVQTRSENNGAKVARMATISGGGSTGDVSRRMACVLPSILVNDPLGLPANLAKVEFYGALTIAAVNSRNPSCSPGLLQRLVRPRKHSLPATCPVFE